MPDKAVREIAEELAHPTWTLAEKGFGRKYGEFRVHPESVVGRTMRLARAYLELIEQKHA